MLYTSLSRFVENSLKIILLPFHRTMAFSNEVEQKSRKKNYPSGNKRNGILP
jgi:hypothetical protein